MDTLPKPCVVVGAAGQLGRDLCSRLGEDVTSLTRADADLTDADALRNRLLAIRPKLVFNTAAYNFVDRAEDDPAAAFAVNSWAVRTLAEICRDIDALLVHFSTDYVFGLNATRRTPYQEEDAPGPISIYGMSKLIGEYIVRSRCPRHLVIRTCGLYGRWGVGGKGGNFVETMLRLAKQGRPLRVVTDQRCTPSYTADIAQAAIELVENGASGLRHLTNDGNCSWFEFAQAIFELAKVEADLQPTTTEAYGARAPRPRYSVLASAIESTPRLRHWREALAAYLEERSRA